MQHIVLTVLLGARVQILPTIDPRRPGARNKWQFIVKKQNTFEVEGEGGSLYISRVLVPIAFKAQIINSVCLKWVQPKAVNNTTTTTTKTQVLVVVDNTTNDPPWFKRFPTFLFFRWFALRNSRSNKKGHVGTAVTWATPAAMTSFQALHGLHFGRCLRSLYASLTRHVYTCSIYTQTKTFCFLNFHLSFFFFSVRFVFLFFVPSPALKRHVSQPPSKWNCYYAAVIRGPLLALLCVTARYYTASNIRWHYLIESCLTFWFAKCRGTDFIYKQHF